MSRSRPFKSSSRTNITIYTDASLDMQSGAMGWAAWVKWAADGKKEISGQLKLEKACSTLAELTAIYIAVQHISQTMKTIGCQLVVVTDSQSAINILKGSPHSYSEFRKKVFGCLQPDTKLVINKVKAHSNKDGVRSWVNNRVDELAKLQMRQLRKQLTESGQGSLL